MSDHEVETELEHHIEEEPAQPDDSVYVVARAGGQVSVRELAMNSELSLGRSADASIVIDDTRVSRLHTRLSRSERGVVVTDLGSRNGTRVNAAVLRSSERVLIPGDVIRLGPAEIVVAVRSGHAARGGLIARELEHGAARWAGVATLVRIAGHPEATSSAAAALEASLGGAATLEELADGECVALVPAGAAEHVKHVIGELARSETDVTFTLVHYPMDGADLNSLVQRARQLARAEDAPLSGGVLVADPEMMKVMRVAQRVANAPTTVLIVGETGVGKEVVAEQIHRWSERRSEPFVRLNCASLPESLFESELFGYERGAFTGAERTKIGYLEAAHGGTLLLDEIGELAPPLQTKLLRVLETRRVGRLGGTADRELDVRFLCATHRDLAAEAAAGRFREDLYYRIGVFPVRVPPLRERPADIALLAEWFARTFAGRLHRPTPRIQPAAAARLQAYAWPGNVRELRNAMEVAVLMAEGGAIDIDHLPDTLRKRAESDTPGAIRHRVEDAERRSIEEALAATRGNRTHAALRLGISRRALVYKLAKYGIR
ncbi:MAG TPA: sigma 54-interacting transcriptional regulator [Polyangiaceae bacterium]|nr:sigma 54-interacting transcriptional regulator [Polyangiaceae bacterium]